MRRLITVLLTCAREDYIMIQKWCHYRFLVSNVHKNTNAAPMLRSGSPTLNSSCFKLVSLSSSFLPTSFRSLCAERFAAKFTEKMDSI